MMIGQMNSVTSKMPRRAHHSLMDASAAPSSNPITSSSSYMGGPSNMAPQHPAGSGHSGYGAAGYPSAAHYPMAASTGAFSQGYTPSQVSQGYGQVASFSGANPSAGYAMRQDLQGNPSPSTGATPAVPPQQPHMSMASNPQPAYPSYASTTAGTSSTYGHFSTPGDTNASPAAVPPSQPMNNYTFHAYESPKYGGSGTYEQPPVAPYSTQSFSSYGQPPSTTQASTSYGQQMPLTGNSGHSSYVQPVPYGQPTLAQQSTQTSGYGTSADSHSAHAQSYQASAGGHGGPTGPIGNAVLDPKQVPSPASVHASDQRLWDQQYYTSVTCTSYPYSWTDYYGQDAYGQSHPRMLRSTCREIPATHDTLQQMGLTPLGLVICPFAALRDEGEHPVPLVTDLEAPIRCDKCRGYMNPFCRFIEQGRKFVCSLCQATNTVPDSYFSALDPSTGRRLDIQKRPELCYGTFDLIAPKVIQISCLCSRDWYH
jgi:hypothetical protein